jgi:hypothetical protein
MNQSPIPVPPTDDPTKVLGWIVGLLLALAAFLWRLIEKARADLKLAHEREVSELKATHARELGEMRAAHARDVSRLETMIERDQRTILTLGEKCDGERKRNDELVDRVATAALSRRKRMNEPEDFEAEMPTEVRRRIDIVPRRSTPPGTRGPGRY